MANEELISAMKGGPGSGPHKDGEASERAATDADTYHQEGHKNPFLQVNRNEIREQQDQAAPQTAEAGHGAKPREDLKITPWRQLTNNGADADTGRTMSLTALAKFHNPGQISGGKPAKGLAAAVEKAKKDRIK